MIQVIDHGPWTPVKHHSGAAVLLLFRSALDSMVPCLPGGGAADSFLGCVIPPVTGWPGMVKCSCS